MRPPSARIRGRLLHLARVVLVMRRTSQFGLSQEMCEHVVVFSRFGMVCAPFTSEGFRLSCGVSVSFHVVFNRKRFRLCETSPLASDLTESVDVLEQQSENPDLAEIAQNVGPCSIAANSS